MRHWNKYWLGAGLVILLGTASCSDSDPIGGYCGIVSYCYVGTEYADCMESQESEEQSALAEGALCHEAFLAFHDCMAERSCTELDAFYAEGDYCGASYAVWQSRCSGN